MSTKPLEKINVIPQDELSALVPVTPMDMLNRAVSSGADIDMIEKLMNLQERWEASQARKAFDEAVAAAKKEIPPIQRSAKGHNEKRYADFAAIAKVVDPIIGAHGLSYRFRTAQSDRISVTCILSHKAGHSEETTLVGPADTTGNKNAIQAIGSTLTYLQRYSLVQMLGLAAAADDDGKAAGEAGAISLEQVEELVALADEVGADKEAFCRYFQVDGIANISTKDFPRAIAALNKKRAAK
ncbi:MAG TPA: ERF family protein [Verrucomicrobiae bacterium]|nr:ERF family protein [Verrucomicrobiae bacterium]